MSMHRPRKSPSQVHMVPALTIESPTPVWGRVPRPAIPRILLPVREEEEEEGCGKGPAIRVTGSVHQIAVSVPEVVVSGTGSEIAVSTSSPPAG